MTGGERPRLAVTWLRWLYQQLRPLALLLLALATIFHGLRLASGANLLTDLESIEGKGLKARGWSSRVFNGRMWLKLYASLKGDGQSPTVHQLSRDLDHPQRPCTSES